MAEKASLLSELDEFAESLCVRRRRGHRDGRDERLPKDCMDIGADPPARRFPPRLPADWVRPASGTHEAGSLTMSAETIGSSGTRRMPSDRLPASSSKAASISCAVAGRSSTAARSTSDPVGTGTRIVTPSSRPVIFEITRPIGLAARAPVLVLVRTICQPLRGLGAGLVRGV